MLISEFLEEIAIQISGDPDAGDDTELAAVLLVDMKSALRKAALYSRSRMIKLEKSLTHTVGDTTETRPSGLLSVRGDAYYELSGDRVFVEHIKNDDLFHQYYRGESTGAPKYFRMYQNVVEFDRKADQTRTIYIPCFASISDIQSSDSWAYTDEEMEIIKDGTKHFYYLTEEDGAGPASNNYGSLFKDGLDRLEEIWMREEYPNYIQEGE